MEGLVLGQTVMLKTLCLFCPAMKPGVQTSGGVGAISAAPLGNAGVLPISWMYCRMMGSSGLRHATEAAILAANYVSVRLRDHYPTLYTGTHGRIAHECILTCGHSRKQVASLQKMLPNDLLTTDSMHQHSAFQYPDLMVEPTESEDLQSLIDSSKQ